MISRATIVKNGKLTSHYSYFEDYISDNSLFVIH